MAAGATFYSVHLANTNIDHDIKNIWTLGMTAILNNMNKMESEKLYYDISNLCKRNKLRITNEEPLKCELKRYGFKNSRLL